VRGFFIVEMKAVIAVPDGVDTLIERDPFSVRLEAGNVQAGS
jgi:hypothetical protein